jgi:protein-tyrosine phosphatase
MSLGMPTTDLHCHVLPGIDDGPATIDDSLALARAAAAAGTAVLVATPHVNRRYHNHAETIARLAHELNERLATEGIATPEGASLEVRTGAEVALTRLADLQPQVRRRLCLGGAQWLLVEPPFTPVATGIDEILLELVAGGQRVVLAHPERCPAFQRHPEMLGTLVDAGVLLSITAGALVGDFGSVPRELAMQLVRDGLMHNVASDAHDHVDRPPMLLPDIQRAGLGPLAQWLTDELPSAILSGSQPPPRPQVTLPAVEGGSHSRWRGVRRR